MGRKKTSSEDNNGNQDRPGTLLEIEGLKTRKTQLDLGVHSARAHTHAAGEDAG